MRQSRYPVIQLSRALPQKSDYWGTFEASCISAPKIILTDWIDFDSLRTEHRMIQNARAAFACGITDCSRGAPCKRREMHRAHDGRNEDPPIDKSYQVDWSRSIELYREFHARRSRSVYRLSERRLSNIGSTCRNVSQ